MDDPAAPRKRRRTRSSLVAEDDHTPERPNLKDVLDHHAAIAAAANFQVDADTQLERRATSEVTVIDGDSVAITEVAVIESSIIAATLDVPAEPVVDSMDVDVSDEIPETGPLETDMDDDDFLEKALAAATSAALASTRLGQNGIHNGESEEQPEEQPGGQQQQQQQLQQQEQPQQQVLQPSADYNYAMNTWTDPSLHLRVQSLPILENLVGQSALDLDYRYTNEAYARLSRSSKHSPRARIRRLSTSSPSPNLRLAKLMPPSRLSSTKQSGSTLSMSRSSPPTIST